MKLGSIKIQLIIFLAGFAVYLSIVEKDIIFLLGIIVAVISALTVESAILFFKNRTFSVTDSSLISGLIIGYVLSGDQPLWILVLASALAVGSKHLIRINKKHLFNPAAFGVFLVSVLFGAAMQWKGTYVWYILVSFGIYFILKIRKIELLISYFLSSLVLFGVQALMQQIPLSNIFGYFSYFFIFVMLIEPKTTPITSLGKVIFGIGTAILIFIFTEMGVNFDAELGALLIFNLTAPLLNKF